MKKPKAPLTGIPDQHARRRRYCWVQLPAGAEGPKVCKKSIGDQQTGHRDLWEINITL